MSSSQGPLAAPRDAALPSPRARFGPGFDGVLSGGDSWTARRKAAEALAKSAGASREPGGETDSKAVEIKEEEEPDIHVPVSLEDKTGSNIPSTVKQSDATSTADETSKEPEMESTMDLGDLSLGSTSQDKPEASSGREVAGSVVPDPPPSAQHQVDLASVEWSYLDPQGNVQGKYMLLSLSPAQLTIPASEFACSSRTVRC